MSIANFDGSAFDDMRFSGATFKMVAHFVNVTFKGAARFKGVAFQGAADFSQSEFQGTASFSRADIGKSLPVFEGCICNRRFRGTDTYEWGPIPEGNDGLPVGAKWDGFPGR